MEHSIRRLALMTGASLSAAQRLFYEVEQRGLPVDTLVNNADFGFYGPFATEARRPGPDRDCP